MNLKDIKKCLMTRKRKIVLGKHAKEQLLKRGYTKADICSALLGGTIIEQQGANKVAIAGKDTDNNPVIIIIAKELDSSFKIVTVMPPIDHQRFIDCI
ncbi:DUF4258 domain-containing protein [Neobacillus sp.]|uniref:DUF4258 domain-containing protein n=1 Tax=Neobacillus sp. TaxID=2675273 RepID=UPI0035B52AEC